MVNQILSALENGFSEDQVLDFILKKFPKFAKKISSAKGYGFTSDQIINYFLKKNKQQETASPTETEHERTMRRNIEGRNRRERSALQLGTLAATSLAAPTAINAISRAIPGSLRPLLPSLTGLPTAPNQTPDQQSLLQQPLAQQPPFSPTIPQPTQALQPEIKPINATEILTKHDSKEKIDHLISAGNGPESIVGYFKKFYPNIPKEIEKEAGMPFEKVVEEYAKDQRQRLSERELSSSLERGSPSIISEGNIPSSEVARRQQDLSASQISTAAPEGGTEPKRAMTSSTLAGPINSIEKLPLGSKDPDSNRIVRQKFRTVNDILTQVNQTFPDFKRKLEDLKKEIPGISSIKARVKDKENIEKKLAQKNAPAYTLGDYIGGRIVYDSDEALDKIKEKFGDKVFEVDDFIENPRAHGYRALHYQLDIGDGLSAEIQVMPKEIAEVFPKAHALYDNWKRKVTYNDQEKMEMFTDYLKMKEMYDDAMDRYEERNKEPSAKKTDTVATPQGVGEVKEIRNGKAIVEVDGKKHLVDEDELLLPPKEAAVKALELIKSFTPEELRSTHHMLNSYDEEEKKGFFVFHNGSAYVVDDISPEEYKELSEEIEKAKTTGENIIGKWSSGEGSRGSAYNKIVKGVRERKVVPSLKKTFRKLKVGYNLLSEWQRLLKEYEKESES